MDVLYQYIDAVNCIVVLLATCTMGILSENEDCVWTDNRLTTERQDISKVRLIVAAMSLKGSFLILPLSKY